MTLDDVQQPNRRSTMYYRTIGMMVLALTLVAGSMPAAQMGGMMKEGQMEMKGMDQGQGQMQMMKEMDQMMGMMRTMMQHMQHMMQDKKMQGEMGDMMKQMEQMREQHQGMMKERGMMGK